MTIEIESNLEQMMIAVDVRPTTALHHGATTAGRGTVRVTRALLGGLADAEITALGPYVILRPDQTVYRRLAIAAPTAEAIREALQAVIAQTAAAEVERRVQAEREAVTRRADLDRLATWIALPLAERCTADRPHVYPAPTPEELPGYEAARDEVTAAVEAQRVAQAAEARAQAVAREAARQDILTVAVRLLGTPAEAAAWHAEILAQREVIRLVEVAVRTALNSLWAQELDVLDGDSLLFADGGATTVDTLPSAPAAAAMRLLHLIADQPPVAGLNSIPVTWEILRYERHTAPADDPEADAQVDTAYAAIVEVEVGPEGELSYVFTVELGDEWRRPTCLTLQVRVARVRGGSVATVFLGHVACTTARAPTGDAAAAAALTAFAATLRTGAAHDGIA